MGIWAALQGPTVKLRLQLRTELVPSRCTGAALEETSVKQACSRPGSIWPQ